MDSAASSGAPLAADSGLDLLRRLHRHMQWADGEVLGGLAEADPPPTDTLELFSHVLAAEHVWLSRLRGVPATVEVWPMLSFPECARLADENRRAWNAWMDALLPEDLARAVDYRNSAGGEFTSRVDDIVAHVLLHGAYHRGQIARAFRQEGAAPRPTDYIAFARGAPAATRTARP